MTRRRVRALLAVPVLAGFFAFVVWGVADIPRFGDYRGPYGYVLNRIATPQRHTTNVVSAIVFDYRGFDTLGEEFILFGAVLGVVLLLRSQSDKEGDEGEGEGAADDEEVVDEVTSDTLRTVGIVAAGVAFAIGFWLVAFGFVTPGGGFQGGVAAAGAFVLVYTTASYRSWKKVSNETIVDPLEGLGVGAFAALGLATLIAGAPFLHNFLGPGKTGTLVSGGSLPLLNWATALAVTAANVVLCSEFLRQYVVPIAKKRTS